MATVLSLGSHSLLLGPLRPIWEGRQGQGYLHNIPKQVALPWGTFARMIKARHTVGIMAGTLAQTKAGTTLCARPSHPITHLR